MDKAVWVVRDKITTKSAIDDLMADATTRGIHDVVVQVGGRGDAYYDSIRYPQVTYADSPTDHAAVTALVSEGAKRLRKARPGIVISAAVFPDPDVARERVLQRWPEWAEAGFVDLLCPMAYRRDTTEVARLLTKARAAAPKTRMWGGLIAYVGERELVREQVRAAEHAGCEGAILFAYDPTQRALLDVFAAT